jgi:Protein of unknown function (DUF3551)
MLPPGRMVTLIWVKAPIMRLPHTLDADTFEQLRPQLPDPPMPALNSRAVRCLQSYGIAGSSISCRYVSLAQCQMVASGCAAQCITNPCYGRARRRQ